MSRRCSRFGKPPCTFHVILWEGSSDGISFGNKDRVPDTCNLCENMSDLSRYNLDLVHASLRMLGKEGDTFRSEVEDFVYLSPSTMIRYDVHRFKNYNARFHMKVLTERITLVLPLRVQAGYVESREAGVDVRTFRLAADGISRRDRRTSRATDMADTLDWLEGYGRRVREAAADQEGVAALVVADHGGLEVTGVGLPHPYVEPERRARPPITEVILLVGGASGFGDGVLQNIEQALTVRGVGCHVGPVRLAFPSSSCANAAICDFFMCYDRRMLLPMLDAIRVMGEKAFAEFCHRLRAAVYALATVDDGYQGKLAELDDLRRSVQAAARR